MIPYQRNQFQKEIHQDKTRFKVIVWHRRARKTTAAINEIIKRAISNPNYICWYVAPTYRDAKEIVWLDSQMLFKYLPGELIESKNEVGLWVKLKNGSRIVLKGVDNPESLRGQEVNFIVFDEYQKIALRWKDKVWEKIVRPVIEANQGEGWFIGTPEGITHFYQLYQKGKAGEKEWKSFFLNIFESGIFTREQIKKMRKEMPDAYFRQELLCEFLEDASSFFTGINKVLYNPISFEIKEEKFYQLGLDLGKYQDFTVLYALDVATGQTKEINRFNQLDWTYQETKILADLKNFKNYILRIDSTGLGDPIFDRLSSQGINIEPFVFNQSSREDLLKNLAILIETKQIYLSDEEALKDELKGFQHYFTGSSLKLISQVDHDDRVMALALAVYNFNKEEIIKKEPKKRWELASKPTTMEQLYKEMAPGKESERNPFHFEE